MSDQGAPEAQPVRVEPQFMIQSLQNKVAGLTNENMMLEAFANQQQAVTQQLAEQIVALQAENGALKMAAAQPAHNGRVTPIKPKKQIAKA